MTLQSFGMALASAAVFSATATGAAQTADPHLFSDMRWREIGPMRAGRTRALAGVPSEPATFYLGAVNGGVWKTTDAGETWHSVWNEEPSGSIGAIAVADSDPNVLYVGSGEGLQRPDLSTGDGVYKSTDAGKSWTHLGLRDGQQIGKIAIDPRDSNRVFVAVTGHPFGPNPERGIYRSTDGGKTFKKVLFTNDRTGGSDVEIDPQHPNIVFAGMWQRQEAPWENGSFTGAEGGMYRSTDGGDHWTKLTAHGLPDDILQVNVTVSPADSRRVYAAVATTHNTVGLYRSDNEGVDWFHVSKDDPRPEARIGGGDVPVPRADPKDPDTVYVASVVTWKSTDGGKSWFGLRGAPGGDDYQNVFVNPNNTKIIALASDQGVIISENGGQSWSQWYNQATAQMYHVTADNAFPYRVCGGQQDSGSACVASRSDDGRITFHDWHPAGIEEYGYAAPDPLNPDIVYGGKVTRYDRRTGQIRNVEPKPLRDYRVLRTEPLMFSPVDPHKLFFGTNSLWVTSDEGQTWKVISPDLSRPAGYPMPAVVAKNYGSAPAATTVQRGVIYSLGLSPLDGNRLWAGTDDGLIWTTADGGAHWANVTPPALAPFWKVFNMDAGHFDAGTAYAAVNTMRLDDMRPHLFRTHDAGKTWAEIDNGLPTGAATSAIREDPRQKGLLYAGSETEVYVSFDDGEHWESLRLNMPASSVRDLTVKDDDLIAGTHGRGFLILDDVTPLRQIAAQRAEDKAKQPAQPQAKQQAGHTATLYTPERALRIRADMNPPTPWPPDMATGENPPDGAILDYFLPSSASGPVTLEVLDSKGSLVGRFSSADPVPPLDPRYPVPTLWARPPRVLSATPGHHRFLWDMHYPEVPGMSTGPDADHALPHDTPSVETSPWVMPGEYTVRLTVEGKTMTVPLQVVMDPRVKTSEHDLQAQFDISKAIYDDTMKATAAIHEITVLRAQLKQDAPASPALAESQQIRGSAKTAAGGAHPAAAASGKPPVTMGESVEITLDKIAGRLDGSRGAGRGAPAGPPTLASVRVQLARIEHSIQSADFQPTAAQMEAYQTVRKPLPDLLAQWDRMKKTQLQSLNEDRLRRHLPLLTLDTSTIDHDVEDQIEVGDEP